MSTSRLPSGRWMGRAVAILLVTATLAGLAYWWHSRGAAVQRRDSHRVVRELSRSQLALRDGRLYAAGDTETFNGRLFENFPNSGRKLEIEIRDGKVHGRSLGYFENRKLEVEEFFKEGVSHGLRTRWDDEGRKRSEEQIEHGKLNGRHLEWHDNGSRALEMTLRNGQPEGVAEAWFPSGELKSRTRFAGGKIVEREFFTDGPQPDRLKQGSVSN